MSSSPVFPVRMTHIVQTADFKEVTDLLTGLPGLPYPTKGQVEFLPLFPPLGYHLIKR